MKLQPFTHQARTSALMMLALMLTSCGGGITVKVNYDHTTNFAALRSFAFKDAQGSSRTAQLVREAVQQELISKGYALSQQGPPDFQVAYHAATEKQTIWQREYSPTGVPTGVVPITFDEGTVAIRMLDPKTEKLIWMGQAGEAVDNQTQALEDVQPEVKKILTRFPPR